MVVLAFLLPKVSSAFFPTTLACPPFFHSRRHFAWFLSPVCFSSLETEPCLPSSTLRKKLTRTRRKGFAAMVCAVRAIEVSTQNPGLP